MKHNFASINPTMTCGLVNLTIFQALSKALGAEIKAQLDGEADKWPKDSEIHAVNALKAQECQTLLGGLGRLTTRSDAERTFEVKPAAYLEADFSNSIPPALVLLMVIKCTVTGVRDDLPDQTEAPDSASPASPASGLGSDQSTVTVRRNSFASSSSWPQETCTKALPCVVKGITDTGQEGDSANKLWDGDKVGWSADSLCQLQVFSKDPLMGVDIRAAPWGNGEDEVLVSVQCAILHDVSLGNDILRLEVYAEVNQTVSLCYDPEEQCPANDGPAGKARDISLTPRGGPPGNPQPCISSPPISPPNCCAASTPDQEPERLQALDPLLLSPLKVHKVAEEGAKGSQELQQQMLTASDMRRALGAPGIQRMEGPGGWVACRDFLETMGLKQSLPDREEPGKQKIKRKKDDRRGWCLESKMIEHLGSNG
ncbi:Protein Fam86C2P-Like [Manis pentadactyla]|nr:Protein Fam86C2P-Like [Manis pentadactyla]